MLQLAALDLAKRIETRACTSCDEEFEATVFGRNIATKFCRDCVVAQELEYEKRQTEENAQRWRSHVETSVAESEIPALFANAKLISDRHHDAVAAAQDWVTCGGGLWLHGEVGTGKSYLAAAAARARIRDTGRVVRWVSTARLMLALRSGFDSESYARHIEIALDDGDAVFDDLDKVNPTEHGREVIYSAINARVESKAAWIVTSNQGPGQLAGRVGEGVVSRLVECGRVYELTGEDRRLAP